MHAVPVSKPPCATRFVLLTCVCMLAAGEAPGQAFKAWASGLDKIEFLLAAGPAEPLQPLRNVASGGESARVMLALKAAPFEAPSVFSGLWDSGACLDAQSLDEPATASTAEVSDVVDNRVENDEDIRESRDRNAAERIGRDDPGFTARSTGTDASASAEARSASGMREEEAGAEGAGGAGVIVIEPASGAALRSFGPVAILEFLCSWNPGTI